MFLQKIFSVLLAYAVLASSSQVPTITASCNIVTIQLLNGKVICNGGLINKNTVVTAAACLAFYDTEKLVVGINGQVVKFKSSCFDSDFDSFTMKNDVAIIKLAEPVQANYLKVATSQRNTGASAVVSSLIGNVPVTIVNTSDCGSGNYGWSKNEIFETMLCGYATDNKTCVGRRGSPVIQGNKLIGLVSWGGCGSKSKPAVFTNIATLKPWIKENQKN